MIAVTIVIAVTALAVVIPHRLIGTTMMSVVIVIAMVAVIQHHGLYPEHATMSCFEPSDVHPTSVKVASVGQHQ